MRKLLLLALVLGFATVPARAQSTCSSNANTLFCLPAVAVNNLQSSAAGAAIPTVPAAFSGLNSAIAFQLSEVPTPSPASGIVFDFNANGVLTSQQRELGPIFSDAPPTVGPHKLYLAFTYQFLEFDQIDEVSLKQIPLQISTPACTPPSGVNTLPSSCSPFIVTVSRLDLRVNEFTAYATYGLGKRVDISVAVPILDVRMGMQTRCSVCSQSQPDGSVLVFTPNFGRGEATGIGDVTFRGKYTVFQGKEDKGLGLAIGVDIRVPTGNALNLLGSGVIGVRPFMAMGYQGRISPHVDVATRQNGSSIVAGSGQINKAELPNSLDYSGGLDFGIVRRLSVTGDFLGQTFFNANRVVEGLRQPSNLPDISCNSSGAGPCQGQTFTTKTVSAGGKINPAGNLLITANVLVRLDHNGLHYRPAPMIGISYTF